MELEWWVVSLHLALGSLIWALLWAAALYGWYRARVAVVEASENSSERTVPGPGAGLSGLNGPPASPGLTGLSGL